jgi:hypothetical protein
MTSVLGALTALRSLIRCVSHLNARLCVAEVEELHRSSFDSLAGVTSPQEGLLLIVSDCWRGEGSNHFALERDYEFLLGFEKPWRPS